MSAREKLHVDVLVTPTPLHLPDPPPLFALPEAGTRGSVLPGDAGSDSVSMPATSMTLKQRRWGTEHGGRYAGPNPHLDAPTYANWEP